MKKNYVVFDLEMCNVLGKAKKESGLGSEIIEIGAVLLNEFYEPVDSFITYVSPTIGNLTSRIRKLTGITKDKLIGAPKIEDALHSFKTWLPQDVTLISWSENDARQIKKELSCKGIDYSDIESLLQNSIDCQLVFADKVNSNKCYSLADALIIANVDYCDGAHDALVDAKNTAYLFKKLMNSPACSFCKNYSFGKKSSETYNPFAELLKDYSFAV